MATVIPFLEKVADETPTIGGFTAAANTNSFDECFKEACEELRTMGIDPMMDINQIIKKEDVAKVFSDRMLSGIIEESASRTDPDAWGGYVHLPDQLKTLHDNVRVQLLKEATTVGQLMPIKAIDYPLVIKQHVALATKDIIQTEVTKSPVVKKQIERTWIVNNQTGKRWEYPQCFFKPEEAEEIWAAGKGLPIKDTPVTLPQFNYDIIGNLTDAAVPQRERLSLNPKIVAGKLADGTVIPLDMHVDLHLGVWCGGKIDTDVTDTAGSTVHVTDEILGSVDFINYTTTISSANGQIVSVVFGGYLSNEKNERAVGMEISREEKEWHIEDGHRANVPYSVEQLEEAKALLDLDLYKRTYDWMTKLLVDMEDDQIIKFLDAEFIKYSGVELDPLGFNSFIRETNFNCDSTVATTALPSEYIQNELKFLIDRFLIDITETAKMEDMVFVLYGNPKYISLLGNNVHWVVSNGGSTGGIKHNYSYGIMTTGNVKIQVVSALKFSSYGDMHKGLRLIPYPLNKEQITFKHFKYSTHILTAQNSAYRDPDLPGGSMTNIMGVSRYESGSIQGIQGYITFTNDEFVNSTLTTKRTQMPTYQPHP